MSLSIVIPVRNEEEIILKTLEKFENSWLTKMDHEIIIINDNSSDDTVNLIKNNKFRKINVVLKDNYKNDLGSAIITGIDNSSKIIGYPSEIPVLVGHLVDDKKFTDEGWRECWGYAHENADVFELNLWIYRTGEGDTPAETETVVLKELIQELNECISTIIGMWKGLERDHRKTIHSGILLTGM